MYNNLQRLYSNAAQVMRFQVHDQLSKVSIVWRLDLVDNKNLRHVSNTESWITLPIGGAGVLSN